MRAHTLFNARFLFFPCVLVLQVFENNVVCQNQTAPVFGVGVSASPSPASTSVAVGFDYNVPCGPAANTPPDPDTGKAVDHDGRATGSDGMDSRGGHHCRIQTHTAGRRTTCGARRWRSSF